MTDTGTEHGGSPAAEFAGSIVDFGRTSRSRVYPDGIFVDLYGFPDFLPYARAVIETGPVPPGLGIDEARVTDVIAANLATAGAGDPLYADLVETATPRGWTWHHAPHTRRLHLVPVDVANAILHHGGVATMTVDRERTGLWSPVEQAQVPARLRVGRPLTDGDLSHLEHKYLKYRLPDAYRALLIDNGGGPPARPAVHLRHGFVLDQQFLNLYGEYDPYDLLDVAARFTDRLTADFLAVAWVQGGALVLKTQGEDAGSVWYWDNDDRYARQGDTPEATVALMSRLAGDLTTLLADELVQVPDELDEIARTAVAGGHYRPVVDNRAGTGLPADLRP
ncbi:SMI1/KNR4 family protein [Embleya sp. NPDC020886]|uniref:SMI1/KNR4 family protein n=1 Tax=Embleya sp. NPDC020886 TaxID=3363980 RepID=UPI0037B229DD